MKTDSPEEVFEKFTMNREVEVQNIQLTATTPEDIQISLGKIGSPSDDNSLAKSGGYLTVTDGVVADPESDYDWSNIADISHYYSFGKLIPASSNNGANIYFTPDANGVGKTLKDSAEFYTAAIATEAQKEDRKVDNVQVDSTYNATAHVNAAIDTWATGNEATDYKTATAWNKTEDDGYYVDIPVWFRTSSTQGAELSVQAAVYDNTTTPRWGNKDAATDDDERLYKAVRVVVLKEDGTVATTNNTIPVMDGGEDATSGTYTGSSILDWYERTDDEQAVSTVSSKKATYSKVTPMTTGTSVIDLTGSYKGTGGTYGTGRKYIIRVWLEGEDPDCWNETSGQDWSISLKFTNATSGSNT